MGRAFPTWKGAGDTAHTIVCFPWAGAGAAAFRPWRQWLPPEVDLTAARFPGRESRFREAPIDDLDLLIADILGEFPIGDGTPFTLFGHCSGGLIAFELARALRRRGGPLPSHLVVASEPAPSLPRDHPVPTAEQVRGLLRRGGYTKDLLLDREDVLSLMLPAIEADFRLTHRYRYQVGPPLDIPVTVLAGRADPVLDLDGYQAWQRETTADFAVELLPGDHFFNGDGWRVLMEAVVARIRPEITGDG